MEKRPMSSDAILVNDLDNVATALKDLSAGQTVNVGGGASVSTIVLCQAIQAGHKLAIRDIKKRAAVIKYGETIGAATEDIPAGSHVHIHNVEGHRGRGDLN
jgi:altronate dehydratase small subunit